MARSERRFSPVRVLLGIFLLLIAGTTARGQSTAAFQGTVLDAQGGAIAGAKVTVKNLGTGLERSTETDGTGNFSIPALPSGNYRVDIAKTGFRTLVASPYTLEVATTASQTFTLQVGQVAEIVEVSTGAPVIESSTMTVGQVIDQKTVQEIPLNGRHFVDLALLIPGTVTPPQNGFLTAPLRGQGSFAFNTAGNREDSVNFMINGVNLNDMVQNQVTFQPTINTVAEFRVDNSTYSAEYGRNSGAIVNIATRSGTDHFHGEAYDYLRNNYFDARNFFNVRTSSTGASLPQSVLKRNQFGGDFGGPIWKGHTYFFASYEGLRHRQGLTTTSNVWTDAQRADITAAGNPISIAIMNLVPRANSGTTFVGSATAPVNIDQGTTDISHNFGPSDRLHGYYVYQHDLRQEPTQGANIPGFGDTREGHRQVLTLNESHVFSPTLVNEARLGANRLHITFTPNNTTDPSTLGLAGVLGPNQAFLPTIRIVDLGILFGDERNFPQGRGDTTGVFADTLSYIRGRHALKFGTEFRDFHNDNLNGDPGQLVFNCSLNIVTPTCSSNQFANGQISTSARTLGNVANRITQKALDLFTQDDFKLKPFLTLELGLRYAWNMTPTEAEDRYVTFDPSTVSLVRVNSPYSQNNKNFQPRVGFSWDMFHSGKTVLRGGYGYLVDQPITGTVLALTSNPPFATPIAVNAPPSSYSQTASIYSSPTPANLSPVLINPDFRNANIQSWNLNMQHEVTPGLGLMVGYFGSKGTHLEVDRNINQPTAQVNNSMNLGPTGTTPFKNLSSSSIADSGSTLASNIVERDSNGNSNYNALWVTANKRFSHGLQFNTSYTWSHSIDDASRNLQGIVVQDSTNIFGSRGSSDFDVRHRFVANAVYNLPFKGNRLVSGWELAPIITAQSGSPFNVVAATSFINGVANSVRVNVSGPIQISGDPSKWITNAASVFSVPATGFGNLGRNAIYGPGFTDVDLSLVKNTKITETTSLQFRVDSFDLLNHPNFGQPGPVGATGATVFSTAASFSNITSTRFPVADSGSSRQLQFALKFLF